MAGMFPLPALRTSSPSDSTIGDRQVAASSSSRLVQQAVAVEPVALDAILYAGIKPKRKHNLSGPHESSRYHLLG
jgi:hypothetical protein